MKQTLISLLAFVAVSAAVAQPAPNPFARPSTPLAAAPAGSPQSSGGPLPPIPTPGQPGQAISPPGYSRGPGGMPGYAPPGMDPAMPNLEVPGAPSVNELEVPVARVGTVNGQVIYRGTGTYLFEKNGKQNVVRKPVVRNADALSGTVQVPSMVGRSSPSH